MSTILYCGRHETLNLDCAKTPEFDDRKRVNISNMDPFTIVESRGFGAVQIQCFMSTTV